MNTGRRFIGMKKDAEYFSIAQKRIAAAMPANDNEPQTIDLFATGT